MLLRLGYELRCGAGAPCAREQSQAAEQPLVCPRSLLRAGRGRQLATSCSPALRRLSGSAALDIGARDAFKVAVDLTDDTKQS